MWSVWSKPVQLYLGQGLVMLQVTQRPAVVLRPSSTLPLERVLQQVNEHLPRASLLRISLSGALCPAFDCVMPQGVRRWKERQAIAQSWVADSLGLPADELVCELDAKSSSLGAALPASTMAQLQRWARARGHSVKSVQPLWAQATQSRTARRAGTRAMVVQEPDATTVLAEQHKRKLQAFSLAGAPDAPTTRTRLAQLQISLGLMPEQLLRLGFDAQEHTLMAYGPQAWATHWYPL